MKVLMVPSGRRGPPMEEGRKHTRLDMMHKVEAMVRHEEAGNHM